MRILGVLLIACVTAGCAVAPGIRMSDVEVTTIDSALIARQHQAAVVENAIANGCRAALPALPSWQAVVQAAPDVAVAFGDLAVASELPAAVATVVDWGALSRLASAG